MQFDLACISLGVLPSRVALASLACLAALAPVLPAQTAHFTYTIQTLGGGLSVPRQIAVDSGGNIYVADAGSNSVKEIPASCTSSSCVVALGGGFNQPWGVAVDSSGNVYVADSANNAVKEIPTGCTATDYSNSICTTTTLGGGFSVPDGVTVDSSGNIYVADTGNNAVKEMPAGCSSSSCVTALGGGFSNPEGVAVDSSGNVYVADTNHSAVKEIPAGCTATAYAAHTCSVSTLGGGFNYVYGVALDSRGNIYVADYFNNEVKEMPAGCASSGCVITLSNVSAFPDGIALDPSGNVYVASLTNSAMQEILKNTNFSQRSVGSSPAKKSFTFTFDSAGTIAAPAVLAQGSPNLDFTDAGTGTCTTNGTTHSYSSGDTCTVDVDFSPQYPGLRNGAVVLKDSSGTAIATAYLYGKGVAPQIAFSPATNAALGGGFGWPWGVAVDGGGNVYVAEFINGTVSEIPPGCASSSCVTPLGGVFSNPKGLAVDGAGNIYVADWQNRAVKEIPAGCTATAYAANSCTVTTLGGGFTSPSAVAVDSSGDVYVSDDGSNAVSEMPAGCASSACVTAVGGGFNQPEAVAIDSAGVVYVADTSNNLVKKVAAGCLSSACVTTLGGGFNQPQGLAIDVNGNLYVADYASSALKEVPSGCTSSSCVTSLASFADVSGDAIDGSGNLYATEATGALEEIERATGPILSFNTTAGGSKSSDSPKTVTVENIGNVSLKFSALSFPADFSKENSSSCTSSSTLGSSCTLSIDFSPLLASATGPSTLLDESVTITDNNLNSTGSKQTIEVKGTESASLSQLAFGTPPYAIVGVGGSAGSAITVMEELASGAIYTEGSDTITLTVTYPDNSTKTYTQAAVNGVATFNLASVVLTQKGSYSYVASLAGVTSAVATESVQSSVAPTFTWNPPSTIIVGDAGTSVLNAVVNCTNCGYLSYSATPSIGSTFSISGTAALTPGSYTITVSFNPWIDGYIATSTTASLTVSGESVWVVNRGGGVAELAGNGYAISSSADAGGNVAAAIDATGNVWSAGTGTTLLEDISQTGNIQHSISGGGLNAPSALAVDGASDVWIANSGNNSISLFLNDGSASSPSTGFTDSSLNNPSGVAVDLDGSVWIANQGNNSLTRFLGAAAPVAPPSTAAKNNTAGAKP